MSLERSSTGAPSSRPINVLFVLILACCLALSPSAVALADSWPQWRGPSRDGQVPGAGWPEDLSSLEMLWRIELGPGYPGPIVAEDRVFVAETVGEETEVVRALDRQTGEEIWRAAWEGAWKVPFFARANGSWIRSTPSYDGSHLYVGGIREVLVCLDGANGEERWRVDFPALYDTKVPDFGFSSSPLVAGEHLYVQAANSILKLDKTTGKTIWRALEGKGSIMVSGAFSSPMLANLAGREQLLVQTRTHLNGLDPQSGGLLWSREVPHFRGMNILTPLVIGDTILTSSYQNGTYLFRVQQEGDGFTVEQEWHLPASGYMSSPVLVGEHAYLHLGNGRFTCLDINKGESCWTSKPFGQYWALAAQGEKILALDSEGEMLLIQADPTSLEVLDRRAISDQPTWGYLAVAGNQVFVRELEAISAYRWPASVAPDNSSSEGAIAAD